MKKLTVGNYLALAFIALAATTAARAQILQVQFESYNPAQTGFDSFQVLGDSIGDLSGTFGPYSVEVSSGPSSNGTDFRSLNAGGFATAGPYDNLYEGFFYDPFSSDVRVEVDGLADNTTYDITVQSVNNNGYDGVSYVRTLSPVDGINDSTIGTYVGAITSLDASAGSSFPSSLTPGSANGDGYYTFTETTNGSGSLSFADSLYDSSGNNTATFLGINGFEVTTAPEPSTLGLMTLTGVLGLIWVARRKKLSV